jgi:hypothetical protein
LLNLPNHLSTAVLAVACVLCALLVLGALVFVVAHRAVEKARPEDLPEVLHGLGQLAASLACFLPWGKKREMPQPDPAPGGAALNRERAVTVVTGHVVGSLPAPAIGSAEESR